MLCCTDLFGHIVSRKWISLVWCLHGPVKKAKLPVWNGDESIKKVENPGHEKRDPQKEKGSGNIKVSRDAVYCDCNTTEVIDDDSSEEMQTETSV